MPEGRAIVNFKPNDIFRVFSAGSSSWEFLKAIAFSAIIKYSSLTYNRGAHASQEHETRTGWLTKRLHMSQIIHRFYRKRKSKMECKVQLVFNDKGRVTDAWRCRFIRKTIGRSTNQ